MNRFLYQTTLYNYRQKLKGANGFKYFSLFNDQILNKEREEVVLYPALTLEFGQFSNQYRGDRILTGPMEINLHVTSESMGSVRENDRAYSRTAEHYAMISKVHRAYDTLNYGSGYFPTGLTVDATYFDFGSWTRVRTSAPRYNKSTIDTVITYRFQFKDQSWKYYEEVAGTRMSTSVLDLVSSGATGFKFKLQEMGHGDYSPYDFSPDFFIR
jgi:hypothetical protein